MGLLDRLTGRRPALTDENLDAIGEIQWILADLAADKAANPDKWPPLRQLESFRAGGRVGYQDPRYDAWAEAGRPQDEAFDAWASSETRPDYST